MLVMCCHRPRNEFLASSSPLSEGRIKTLKSNHIWVLARWQDARVLDYMGKMCVDTKDRAHNICLQSPGAPTLDRVIKKVKAAGNDWRRLEIMNNVNRSALCLYTGYPCLLCRSARPLSILTISGDVVSQAKLCDAV